MGFEGVQKHPRFRVTTAVGVIGSRGEIRELSLEDISLGGAFIRTSAPEPPGSFVRVRMPIGNAGMILMAQVIHVIDGAASVAKSRAPGMGVMFDGLSEDTAHSLQRFVEGIVEQEKRNRARKAAARFVDPTHVEICAERAVLRRLWDDGLARGVVFADGEARLGSRVSVAIGPLSFHADVMTVEPGVGAGLRFVHFDGEKVEALTRFVRGDDDALTDVRQHRVRSDLPDVLAAARRLFEGIDANDPYAALNLSPSASADEIVARTHDLLRAFMAPHPDATPPQLARLEVAVQAVQEVGPELLERVRGVDDDVRALELLTGEFAKDELIDRARRATLISSSREVLLRAMRKLAAAGAMTDMIAVAERLLDLDPHDELPLHALLHVYEGAERWADAARVGEALLRLRPDDAYLLERVRALAEAARTAH